mgnify:CR=1 FL=1
MLQLPKRILSSSAWSSDTPKIVLRSRVKNSDPKGRTAVRSVLCSYTSVIDVVSAPDVEDERAVVAVAFRTHRKRGGDRMRLISRKFDAGTQQAALHVLGVLHGAVNGMIVGRHLVAHQTDRRLRKTYRRTNSPAGSSDELLALTQAVLARIVFPPPSTSAGFHLICLARRPYPGSSRS